MTLALKLVAKCQEGRLDGGVGRAEEWCRSSKAGHRGGNQFACRGPGWGHEAEAAGALTQESGLPFSFHTVLSIYIKLICAHSERGTSILCL